MGTWQRAAAVWLLVAGLATGARDASAAYPERPITLIVAFEAGGGNDVLARMLVPHLERHLGAGARIEVVNRSGAGGELGFAAIADAPADGYTLGIVNLPNLVTIPIERRARYSPDRLDPLMAIVADPGVWVVAKSGQSLTHVVREAVDQPDTVTVGTSGVSSDDHLTLVRMQQITGARYVHVPFSGVEAVNKALRAGKIAVAAENLGEALRFRRDSGCAILGVMSAERSPFAPDLPTFREQGFDVVMGALRGVAAPRGLPAEVRAALVSAIAAAVADPGFVAEAEKANQPLQVAEPDAFARAVDDADREFRALWKTSPWLR